MGQGGVKTKLHGKQVLGVGDHKPEEASIP